MPLFDVLFVDFNALVYHARAVVTSDDFGQLVAEISRCLDLLVKLVKPSTLVYISADGVAPFAKNAEQRRRRENATLSRAALTLGTEFIDKIDCSIREFVEERVKTSAVWQLPNVIYSSFRTPGEGEHKFFEFVMEMRKEEKWNEDAVVCLYSPDPDVILQGLMLGMTKSCLMTAAGDSWKSSSDFEVVWLGMLKEYLMLDLGSGANGVENVVQDFMAMTIVLGNDFIPAFHGFSLDVSVMDKILEIYRTEFAANGRWLLTEGSFNRENTADFLERVCPKEETGAGDADETVEAVIEAYYFVIRYYKLGLSSWTWQYGYETTPSLASVAKYFRNLGEEDVPTFEIESPLSSLEQLVAVLPPSCEELVPEPLRCLLRNYAYEPHELHREFNRVCCDLSDEVRARNTPVPPCCVTISGSEPMKGSCLEINWNINFEGNVIPCLPSLWSSILPVCVKSRDPGVTLGFSAPKECPSDISRLVDKVILVDFPFWKPALVVGIEEAENETSGPLIVLCKAIRFTDENETALEVVDELERYPFLLTKPASKDFMKRFHPISVQNK